eukprot:CAMPEP_0197423422 /NCGR_PEP_ID=MMETSP1170-20131217/21450_1 /TAXON_ID=54406 /ORGANISM="Sarcinochrysis sp, Strain CCMP770" /LENGTH=172 /DNA_ID=CAMNT_0042950843 /DNA_START=6 /DNA_END=524 /DNA_ORIENTATION=+
MLLLRAALVSSCCCCCCVGGFRLEACAKSMAESFRAARDNSDALDDFVSSSVEALRFGYDLRLLSCEIDVQDDGYLSASDRGHRWRWLRTVRHTVDILSAGTTTTTTLADDDDPELGVFCKEIVDAATRGGTHVDRALATCGNAGTVAHVVLLTMRAVWRLDADDLYPGATG